MLRKSGFALVVGSMLAAGSATAQTEATSYEQLSPGGQKIVDALYDAQSSGTTLEGGTTLEKDQIAAYRDDGGWGKIFKDHPELFEGYKNLGQVISSYNRHKHDADGLEVNAHRTDKVKVLKADRVKVHKVDRVQRVSRVDRPKRPNHPHRR